MIRKSGSRSSENYPVVDEQGRLAGIISRADILRWTREDLDEGVTVGDLADRMVEADVGRVPVLERRSGKVVGLVARRDLLHVCARMLREERERGRLLRLPVRAGEAS